MHREQKKFSENENMNRVLKIIQTSSKLTADKMPYLDGIWIPGWLWSDLTMNLSMIDSELRLGKQAQDAFFKATADSQKAIDGLVLTLVEDAAAGRIEVKDGAVTLHPRPCS